jgi:excisionase family DNA binding protein
MRLTVTEAAARLDMTRQAVLKLIHSGRLLAQKAPGDSRHGFHYTVDLKDVIALRRAMTRVPKGA